MRYFCLRPQWLNALTSPTILLIAFVIIIHTVSLMCACYAWSVCLSLYVFSLPRVYPIIRVKKGQMRTSLFSFLEKWLGSHGYIITCVSGNKSAQDQNCLKLFSMKYTCLIVHYHAFLCPYIWDILECSDIWWCTGEVYTGRVGFAGSFPEESLQRCDAGDLQEPQCHR